MLGLRRLGVSLMKTLSRLFKPVLEFGYRTVVRLIPTNRLGDKIFSFVLFVYRHKRIPTKSLMFNDVIYQIKVSDEILDSVRVLVSDKEFVKRYVAQVVGDQFNVPTIKILSSVQEVETYDFPANCCIKPTHASGKVILRRNNEPIDLKQIRRWFSIDHYRSGREANYKTLKPKVIVEPVLFNDFNISDYKIFCYQGSPKLIQVNMDRFIDRKRQFLDTQWNELFFSINDKRCERRLDKPANLEEMLNIAAKLSQGFSFVRVDMYSDGKSCKVGEITNCSENATGRFIPRSAEKIASQIIFGQNLR